MFSAWLPLNISQIDMFEPKFRNAIHPSCFLKCAKPVCVSMVMGHLLANIYLTRVCCVQYMCRARHKTANKVMAVKVCAGWFTNTVNHRMGKQLGWNSGRSHHQHVVFKFSIEVTEFDIPDSLMQTLPIFFAFISFQFWEPSEANRCLVGRGVSQVYAGEGGVVIWGCQYQ